MWLQWSSSASLATLVTLAKTKNKFVQERMLKIYGSLKTEK